MTDKMMSEAKLLPCPFCGGEAAIEQTGLKELTVRCVGIQPRGLRGCGPRYTQKVVRQSRDWLRGVMVERWNRRTVNSHEALVAALHAIIALDHHNMGPESRATKIARTALNALDLCHG